MPITDLLPWSRGSTRVPVNREENNSELNTLDPMSQMIGEFFNDPFGLTQFQPGSPLGGRFFPQIDVTEDNKQVKVTVEVPGMEENDIQVGISDNVLSLSGHKETEKEEKGKRFHRIERTSGSFRRDVPLPAEVDEERAEAVFKNGVLTVTLPKLATSTVKGKRILVRKG